MMKRAGSLVVAGVLVSSCAVVASRDEFAAYRNFRYETNPDRRTTLGAEYLDRYRGGRFASEVQREISAREEEFWEERRSTLEGLQAYLQAFPAGTHVEEARARINVYEAERRRLAEERAAAEQAERERLAAERRAQNERQRLFARNTILYWLRQLGSIEGWGETLGTVAQRNPDFNAAFGGQPEPRCRAGRCVKTYQVDFTVPVPGRTALSRQLTLNLALETIADPAQQGRRLRRAQLVMPRRGLSIWYECETQGQCDPSDPNQRAQSVRWAMDQLKGIVATAFPNARETPPELVGPEPEPEGVEEEEGAQAAAQPVPPILPQPLGVQWSYVVGCGNVGGAQIQIPENARPVGWAETTGEAPPVRACLRIDAFSAPDIEGLPTTNEGLWITYIPPSALPQQPARPGRGRRGAR
jgi:hypothetical protein